MITMQVHIKGLIYKSLHNYDVINNSKLITTKIICTYVHNYLGKYGGILLLGNNHTIGILPM